MGRTSAVFKMGLKTHKISLEGEAMHMALRVDGPAELGLCHSRTKHRLAAFIILVIHGLLQP